MRHLSTLVILSAAVLLVLIGENPCQGENAQDNKQAEQSIFGPWHADVVTLMSEKGTKKTLPINEQQPFNIIVSDKTLTMRVGDQKFAETSYVLDSKQTPCTIDVKFQDQEMSGIYELNGGNLKISLNDAQKGRPKDFDKNSNGMVLILKRFPSAPLFIINADGSDLHQFLSMPDYTDCNSPAWSPDGSKIAFDSWRMLYGEAHEQSHIFVANSDGSSPKDLGDGAMPRWSPDGKQICYTRFADSGIWIINADGSNKHIVDPNYGSADWSPKKNELACTVIEQDSGNLRVHDLETRTSRTLLTKQYSYIYWRITWSPDGKYICYKGQLPDGASELAIVSSEGQEKGFKVLLPNKDISGVKSFENYPTWRPDGKQILLSMRMEDDVNNQYYLLDPYGKEPPKKLAGQDPSRNYFDSSWSPDGKKIVLSSWPGTPVAKKDAGVQVPAAKEPTGFINDSQAQNPSNQEKPLMLDFKRFFQKPASPGDFYNAFTYGEQVLDGVPFNIVGQGCLYGRKGGNPAEDRFSYRGIQVDRKFDKLYLLHGTFWPDVEGDPVAYINLNYADGTRYIRSVRYGVHVRDTYRMFTEEKATLTDPDSKICWRHPPVQFNAPLRLFKTKVENPFPEKAVETIDVVSACNLASYNLLAITVANTAPGDSIGEGQVRKFNGKLTITVLDNTTGKPIAGALVDSFMNGLSAPAYRTPLDGKVTMRYPVGETNSISTTATKNGYISQRADWDGDFPNSFTFRLMPLVSTPPQITNKDLIGTWILAGTPDNVVEPPAAGGRLKFITDKHWTVTQADPDTGEVMFHHGGTYTLNGNEYVETVNYATENTKELISKVHKFKIKVEGDTLIIIGIGNPWTEVWKRAK